MGSETIYYCLTLCYDLYQYLYSVIVLGYEHIKYVTLDMCRFLHKLPKTCLKMKVNVSVKSYDLAQKRFHILAVVSQLF